jgi:hypothetical protein
MASISPLEKKRQSEKSFSKKKKGRGGLLYFVQSNNVISSVQEVSVMGDQQSGPLSQEP